LYFVGMAASYWALRNAENSWKTQEWQNWNGRQWGESAWGESAWLEDTPTLRQEALERRGDAWDAVAVEPQGAAVAVEQQGANNNPNANPWVDEFAAAQQRANNNPNNPWGKTAVAAGPETANPKRSVHFEKASSSSNELPSPPMQAQAHIPKEPPLPKHNGPAGIPDNTFVHKKAPPIMPQDVIIGNAQWWKANAAAVAALPPPPPPPPRNQSAVIPAPPPPPPPPGGPPPKGAPFEAKCGSVKGHGLYVSPQRAPENCSEGGPENLQPFALHQFVGTPITRHWKQHNEAAKALRAYCIDRGVDELFFPVQRPTAVAVPKINHAVKGAQFTVDDTEVVTWDWKELIAQCDDHTMALIGEGVTNCSFRLRAEGTDTRSGYAIGDFVIRRSDHTIVVLHPDYSKPKFRMSQVLNDAVVPPKARFRNWRANLGTVDGRFDPTKHLGSVDLGSVDLGSVD
jgi:hypothetical protein